MAEILRSILPPCSSHSTPPQLVSPQRIETNPNFERTLPHLSIQHLLETVSIGFVSPPNTTTADIVTTTIVTIFVIVATVVAVNIIAIVVHSTIILRIRTLYFLGSVAFHLYHAVYEVQSPTSGTTTKSPC
jgi:hypothetical protein